MLYQIRETLTQDRTYYVRTDGNDSNDGLSNDSAGAFLTIQKAVDVVSDQLDNLGYDVVIQVADGAYNDPVELKPYVGSGSVTLRGNTTTPSNVTITTSGSNAINLDKVDTSWHVEGFKLAASSKNCIGAYGSKITFSDIDFAGGAATHILAGYGAVIQATGNYSISGGASCHVLAQVSSSLNISSATVSLSGTPAFLGAFAQAFFGGQVMASGMTFSGSATGSRYLVASNGVIYNNGGGANYFPGNSAGATFTGGQYL